MTTTRTLALALAAVFTLGTLGAADAQDAKKVVKKAAATKCVQAGGEATMVTEDLAKFMANAALNNSMKAHDQTGSGAVTMKCDSNGLPHCMATQRACK